MITLPPPLSEQDQIAILAYNIYLDEGRPEGCAAEHWTRAEEAIHAQKIGVAKSVEGEHPETTIGENLGDAVLQ